MDSRFRVVLRRDTTDGWVDFILYTEAATAAAARQKVASSHLKPQLARIVSCTAIGDAIGVFDAVFALPCSPAVTS